MGYSFTNLQIRRADCFNPDEIAGHIAGEGWERVDDADQADVSTAVYALPGSPWITVRSDAFEDDPDALLVAAKRLSQTLDTDALAVYCFDSDYLFLNLLNTGKKLDLWANGGSAAALGMTGVRRSNFTAWKNHVTSVADFRNVMKKARVFREECLYDLEGVLSLPHEQSLGGIGEIPEGIEVHWYRYRVSAPKARCEPPSLGFDCPRAFYALDGEECLFTVCNYGGASMGLTVVVEGVKAVENARIQNHDHEGKWVFTPVPMRGVEREDGARALVATLFSLPLPAVNRNLPPRKRMWVEFERGVIFRFVPRSGQEGQLLPAMRVTMIPMVEESRPSRPDSHARALVQYAQGQCVWQGRMPPEAILERMMSEFEMKRAIERGRCGRSQ